MRPGRNVVIGLALFYAWALEQEEGEVRAGGVSGHRFAEPDVLVPFHLRLKAEGTRAVAANPALVELVIGNATEQESLEPAETAALASELAGLKQGTLRKRALAAGWVDGRAFDKVAGHMANPMRQKVDGRAAAKAKLLALQVCYMHCPLSSNASLTPMLVCLLGRRGCKPWRAFGREAVCHLSTILPVRHM